MATIAKETELYLPLKKYLEKQKYLVRSEVKGCDITAVKDEELIIVEMKRRLSLQLVMQAVDRLRITPGVYIAIPKRGKRIAHWRNLCGLLKRLELGLILVHFLKTTTRVEVIFHPKPFTARKNNKRKEAIIREIEGRKIDGNLGGTKGKIYTAYREEALRIAYLLEKHKKLSPKELRDLGTGKKTTSILSKNFYGWFCREKRGVYQLHKAGKTALKEYPEIVKHFTKEYREKLS